jgi:photosystem II stability/assembly factor-like uncharacterized protein
MKTHRPNRESLRLQNQKPWHAQNAISTLAAVAFAISMILSGRLQAQMLQSRLTTVNPTPKISIEATPLNSNRPPSVAGSAVAASVPLPARAGKLVRSARPRPPAESLESDRKADEFFEMLMRNEDGQIPSNALMRAYEEKWKMAEHNKTTSYAALKIPNAKPAIAGIQSNAWTWLGPDNVGGRTRSILIDPLDPNTMWLGGIDGGVWKTVNGGASWYPLDDFMANLAISCMVMDPTDPNVIYAGTGEGYGNGDAIQGAGIFKTTDGGTNWTQLPSTTGSAFHYVNRLAINPTNSHIILAATGEGIYRSTDDGDSWSQSYNKTNTYDVAFAPGDGSQCIASGNGFVLYSTDGGVSWQTATGISATGRGSVVGRIEVAYAPSDPIIVYASAEKNSGELYRSTDGGQTYSLRNSGTAYFSRPANEPEQGWYDNCLWVDPTNPNNLLVGGLDVWRSMDGGNTLTDIAGYPDYPGGPHPDQQVIVSPPDFDGVTNRTVFVGSDGGIYCATNIYVASPSAGWTNLNNGLGITQFYYGAGNASSGVIIGGTQDNGTLRYTDAGGTAGWTALFDSDGFFCASDSTDTNYFYGDIQYLQIFRSSDGGASASYIDSGLPDAGSSSTAGQIAPFVLDPNNPNVMLAGGNSLWRSTNVKAGTPSWLGIKAPTGSQILAIAVAPGNSDISWVGYINGDVYATTNGTAANPSWTRKDLGSPNLPDRYCTRITIDPIDPNKVYVTLAAFAGDNVWRTTDGGATWTDISGNLPGAPVLSLVIAPWDDNTLYIGSFVGVFATSDSGASWSPVNDGPANVATWDLFWVGNELVAATHGRGMFSIVPTQGPDTNAPIVKITAPANNATVTEATLQASGTASDSEKGNNGISSVTVNGVTASGDIASGAGTANWQATVLLHAGLNAITVMATDGMGNTTSPQQITVAFSPPQPFFGGPSINGGTLQTTLSGLSAGETLVLYSSTDLKAWTPVQTNLADSVTLTLTNLINPALGNQYFRERVQ